MNLLYSNRSGQKTQPEHLGITVSANIQLKYDVNLNTTVIMRESKVLASGRNESSAQTELKKWRTLRSKRNCHSQNHGSSGSRTRKFRPREPEVTPGGIYPKVSAEPAGVTPGGIYPVYRALCPECSGSSSGRWGRNFRFALPKTPGNSVTGANGFSGRSLFFQCEKFA